MTTSKIIESPEDIRIFGAFQGFFQEFLRKLWETDKERNWQLYEEEESFTFFWDCRRVEHRDSEGGKQ
jgi:hypothetical protein